MPKINVLPKYISELIAAGEVVERPSSVIKELVENAVDASATKITVEIKRGGITYMSVRDNGCGISRQDVPTAFMRHATSKIKEKGDLDNIGTLGFRGEALAAIAAVAKVEMITRRPEDEIGTRFLIEGGVPSDTEDVGCDSGTLIAVRDIFYNTPARMKFLKSDVTEANSIAAVIDRMALSHPEIAFRFIRDTKITLSTLGDGNLDNTVYSVLGRDFAASLIDAFGENEGIKVSGKVCKPVFCRQNRNGQFFFLNGRLIRSGTASAAIEQAYKNSAMVGKFPCCVLFIEAPANSVDVNVHPTKMEVRFSDERKVFSAVYYAVKNALSALDTRPEIKVKPSFNPYAVPFSEKSQQVKIPEREEPQGKIYVARDIMPQAVSNTAQAEKHGDAENSAQSFEAQQYYVVKPEQDKSPVLTDFKVADKAAEKPVLAATKEYFEPERNPQDNKKNIRFAGQVFNTYIIAECENEIYLIDKHAAHERILYNELKENEGIEIQELLTPVSVTLTKEEYAAITENVEAIAKTGFYVEDFGGSSVAVRAIPAMLATEDISLLITEIAGKILEGKTVAAEKIDDIFHSVACKAAIKGNRSTSEPEMKELAERVLSSNDIMYCPHGRPVAFKITKKELEKYFGRIQ